MIHRRERQRRARKQIIETCQWNVKHDQGKYEHLFPLLDVNLRKNDEPLFFSIQEIFLTENDVVSAVLPLQ